MRSASGLAVSPTSASTPTDARLRTVLISLALGLCAASCGDGDAVRDAKPLHGDGGDEIVVGVDPELPPYSFLDEDGTLQGMVVDLVQEVAKIQELQLSFRTAPMAQLRRALRRGEVDVVPHWPQTAEPPDGILVSLPHSDVSDGVFVRESGGPSPKTGLSVDSWLESHSPIVQNEDPSYEFVADRVPEERILQEPSVVAALRRLAGGDGDYALVPSRTGVYLSRRLGLENLRVLPINFDAYTRGLSFAVREDREELLGEFERGMVIVTENGQYVRIFSEWEAFPADEGPDLTWLLGVLGATIFLLGLSTVWSWSLRRTVARRTAELRSEEAERRRLEAQIQQNQKLESLGILAGGVAHDFNNLLMGILGNVSLARHSESRNKLEERLGEIEQAGRQAAELTQQMLAYSGKGSFRVQELDLSELVGQLETWIRSHLPEGAGVELDLAQDLPALEGDGEQLRQLVQSLVTNACEALDDGGGKVDGKIHLVTSSRYCDAELLSETYLHPRLAAGTYLVLQLSDDGSGMVPDVLERVFDPFFSTKFTGRGLGLAASLGIVRGHRGAIRIDSTPGEGTHVYVYLPAVGTRRDPPSGSVDQLTDTERPIGAADGKR